MLVCRVTGCRFGHKLAWATWARFGHQPKQHTEEVVGDAVARWERGTFSVTTIRRVLVVQLAVTFEDGKRLTFETKSFPVGVNRDNAAVASLILALAARRHI